MCSWLDNNRPLSIYRKSNFRIRAVATVKKAVCCRRELEQRPEVFRVLWLCVAMHVQSGSIASVYLPFSGNTSWPVTLPGRNLFYSRHTDAIRDKCPSTFSPNCDHIQPRSELQLKAAHPSKLSGRSLKLGFSLSAIICFPLSFLPIYHSMSSSYLSLTFPPTPALHVTLFPLAMFLPMCHNKLLQIGSITETYWAICSHPAEAK